MTTAVSVAVTGRTWPAVRSALDRLRPELGPHDELLVDVTNLGQVPLAHQPRTRAIAGGPAGAALAARGAVLVFADADAVPAGHWRQPLVEALASGALGAGPRIAGCDGPQAIDLPDRSPTAVRVFSRSWEAAHRGRVDPIDRLDGAFVAVRTDAGLEWPASVDELPAALAAAGGLVVVHEVVVLVPVAAVPVPPPAVPTPSRAVRRLIGSDRLISACLIVKDEAENLPSCLASVRGFADEIVVYDTGSTDDSVAIARRHGATVIEGYWDDDFARARNTALDHCHGTWVLHIDADEELRGNPGALRDALAHADVERIEVAIDNLGPDGTAIAYRHRAGRLFRRTRARWVGRIHEQLAPLPGRPALVTAPTNLVSLLHRGYTEAALEERHKLDRNVALSEAELAAGGRDRGLLLVNLARSLAAARRPAEALSRFEEALGSTDDDTVRRIALRHGAELLIDLDRGGEALAWTERLRASSDRPAMADYLAALAHQEVGNGETAADLLAGIDRLEDDDGFVISEETLRRRRARACLDVERWDNAVADLVALLAAGRGEGPWADAAEAVWHSGADPGPIAELATEHDLALALAGILEATPAAADGVLEALWRLRPDDSAVLAAGARIGSQLDVERALEWSARLRVAGAAEHCPLVATARDEVADGRRRVRAAAIAHAAFNDRRARDALVAAAPHVSEEELLLALVEVSELAPELLPALVAAAATGGTRSLTLAECLRQLGAPAEADIVAASA